VLVDFSVKGFAQRKDVSLLVAVHFWKVRTVIPEVHTIEEMESD
jgi:hypothetical protein